MVEELPDWAAPDDVDATVAAILSTTDAIALIRSLPTEQAEAVLLRAVMGLDAKAAGRVLGRSAGAVRTAAYRGLRTLAKHAASNTIDPSAAEELR
jgi:RNA polymerase sigma-70 factor (ECF subfamily)